MTEYLKPKFSVALGSKAFSEGWDRIFGPKPACVPLPDDVVRFNGGVRCDMLEGPCACGATHDGTEKP